MILSITKEQTTDNLIDMVEKKHGQGKKSFRYGAGELSAFRVFRKTGTAYHAEAIPDGHPRRNHYTDGCPVDKDISINRKGCLRIDAIQPTVVRLYETGDLGVEDARLIYQAKLRTEGIDGKVYLEMWCSFPGKGEFFSRALQAPLSGTNGWTTQETPFFLRKGDRPDNVKLNLVVDGKGTVWIDDICLLQGPLK